MTEPAPGISSSTVLVAARDQVSTELEGEAVILHLTDGVYYGLDGAGALAWSLLADPRTLGELRDAVAARYAVSPADAERDLAALAADLLARGLVEVVR